MFEDEVTVLEDETIEFIHDAALPRPTSPLTTPIAGSGPGSCEENEVSCCCRTQSHRRHHRYNLDDTDTGTVKVILQLERA